jgi:uncharacterized protein YecE (DUF72 family)
VRDGLAHSALRLPTVEIDNTFHRLPLAALLGGWRSRVDKVFRFAVKALCRITHIERLRE